MAADAQRSGVESDRCISGIGVLGTGSALPGGHSVSNEDIHRLRYGADWGRVFREKQYDAHYQRDTNGFERRYWVHTPGTPLDETALTSVDLMERAMLQAIAASAIPVGEIDLLISFTTTSPRYTSSTATMLAGRAGLRGAAFEVKAGCSSAIHALAIAYQFLSCGARNAVVVGGDTLSKVTDVGSAHLYAVGDGAGAVVLGRVPESSRGLQAFFLDSDGSFADAMGVPGILPPTHESLARGDYTLILKHSADEVLPLLWTTVPERLQRVAPEAARSIVGLVPHQVNRRLIAIGAAAAGVAPGSVADYVSDYANCGPSSLLIALDRAVRDGRFGRGDSLLLCGVGGGLAWGGMIVTL